jgi:hypothetical protein
MSVTAARIGAAFTALSMLLLVPGTSRVHAQVQQGPSNPITVVTATDLDLDTVPDILVTRTFTYQGSRLITTASSTDGSPIDDADGVIDSVQSTAFTYGQGGRIASETTEIDAGNNGTVDSRRVVTNTYGAGGSSSGA